MNSGELTLTQLKACLGNKARSVIALEWFLAPDHDRRVSILADAIDLACSELVQTRHHRQEHSEDALTVDLVAFLKFMDIDASHDTDVGGHSDVVVRGKDDFLWVGEAKKHDAYRWLLEGFDQLTTRYATGLPGQQDGGIIIYCFNEGAVNVMDEWIKRLSAERSGVAIEAGSGLSRKSRHNHVGAGTEFRVHHRVLPMHWRPAAKSASRH